MQPFEVLSKAHSPRHLKQHIKSIYCTNTEPNRTEQIIYSVPFLFLLLLRFIFRRQKPCAVAFLIILSLASHCKVLTRNNENSIHFQMTRKPIAILHLCSSLALFRIAVCVCEVGNVESVCCSYIYCTVALHLYACCSQCICTLHPVQDEQTTPK